LNIINGNISAGDPYKDAWIILGLALATGVGLGATGFLGLSAYKFLSVIGVPQTFLKFILIYSISTAFIWSSC